MKTRLLPLCLFFGCQPPMPAEGPCLQQPPPQHCGSHQKRVAYTPIPSPTTDARIPEPPPLSPVPERQGDAFTVRGIKRLLRDPEEGSRLAEQVTVVGYVVSTNFAKAPKCSLHPAGRPDPAGCVSPLPEFEIADTLDGKLRLRVMGFASNFPRLVTAQQREKQKQQGPLIDDFWAVPVPSPLPAPGARVRVRGVVGQSFARSASGLVIDSRGILTYDALTYLEPPPTPAVLGAGKARP